MLGRKRASNALEASVCLFNCVNLLKMIRAVLIDLSGTLHVENEAITGAADALKKYILICFLTSYISDVSFILD